MIIEETALEGLKVISPRRIGDARGFLSETYNRNIFAAAASDVEFVQDNHSMSAQSGTLRGMHFQAPPLAQVKLVRVIRGAIVDVAVDIRASSPTFGRHFAIELSAANWRQLLIPVGFAHGYCTLEPETEVLYKVSNYYSAAHERGLAWDDPALGIAWPLPTNGAILSEKDRQHPLLCKLETPFA
jgi:dTDP-4-dehydrorhamnose 3,5-epimerase